MQFKCLFLKKKLLCLLISLCICVNAKPNNADSLYNKATAFDQAGAYDKALQEFLKASRKYESSQNDFGLIKTFNSIGLIYIKLKEYDLSRNYFNEAILLLEKKPDKKMRSYIYNNVGMLTENEGQLDSAIYFYEKSLELKLSLEDSIGASRTLTNIGLVFLKKKDFRRAIDYSIKSKSLKIAVADSSGLLLIYSNIANGYGYLGELDSVAFYLREGLKYRTDQISKDLLIPYFGNFAELYKAQNNWELAFAYQDSLSIAQNELFHEEMATELSRFEIEYETEKKEADLKREQIKNNLLEERQKKEDFRFYMLIFLIVGILLVSTLVFVAIRLRLKGAIQKTLLLKKEKKLNEIKIKTANQKQEILEKEVELKSKELISYSTLMLQKQEIIGDLKLNLIKLKKKYSNIPYDITADIDQMLKSDSNIDADWDRFKLHFEQVNTSFFEILSQRFTELSQTDHRHCAYIKIGLSTKEIASLLNITPASVQKSRVRLKKKLQLKKEQDLYGFIQHLIK